MVEVVAAIWRPDRAALDEVSARGAVVRHALPDQGRYGGGSPFDALLTASVDPPGAVEDRLGIAGLGGRVRAWTVEVHRPRVGEEACEVTMVALMRRRRDLTRDQFVSHWTERHTPLALAHHAGLHDYTQNVVVTALRPGADEVDGIAELGFRTRAAFETELYDSDAGRAVIGEDVRRFMAGPGPDTTLLGPPR